MKKTKYFYRYKNERTGFFVPSSVALRRRDGKTKRGFIAQRFSRATLKHCP